MRIMFVLALALIACGDNLAPEPAPDAAIDAAIDADAFPRCEDIAPHCAEPETISHVCAATGECYCDPDGRGPAPKVRCSP